MLCPHTLKIKAKGNKHDVATQINYLCQNVSIEHSPLWKSSNAVFPKLGTSLAQGKPLVGRAGPVCLPPSDRGSPLQVNGGCRKRRLVRPLVGTEDI